MCGGGGGGGGFLVFTSRNPKHTDTHTTAGRPKRRDVGRLSVILLPVTTCCNRCEPQRFMTQAKGEQCLVGTDAGLHTRSEFLKLCISSSLCVLLPTAFSRRPGPAACSSPHATVRTADWIGWLVQHCVASFLQTCI